MFNQAFLTALRSEVDGLTPFRPAEYTTPADLAASIDPGYLRMPHTEYLAQRLAEAVEAVRNGEDRAIIVSMPPRSGKTDMAANWMPLWILHQMPHWNIGYITRESNLATRSGRAVRRQIEAHGPRLGIELVSDRKAAGGWETTRGGGMSTYGIASNVTGHGFEALLLDDLVRDMSTAHSETDRDSIWEWFTSTAFTRLHPPGLLIAIGTRWHEDDWLGRLEEKYEGNLEVIKFPAIAEESDVLGRQEGDPLLSPLVRKTLRAGEDEQAKNQTHWKRQRSTVGEYAWSAEYQQSPSPAGGDIFKTEWWKYYRPGELPEQFDRIYTSWDLTFKGKKTSDYVVGQKWGTVGADFYLLDQVRGQWTFTQTLVKMEAFCKGVIENLVEDKANGPAVIDSLRKKVPGIVAITPRDGKEARARAISPLIEAGNVYLPSESSFTKLLQGELDSFPNARHDDQVDTLTQALFRHRPGRKASTSNPNKVQPPATPKPVTSAEGKPGAQVKRPPRTPAISRAAPARRQSRNPQLHGRRRTG